MLQVIFNDIRVVIVSPASRTIREPHSPANNTMAYTQPTTDAEMTTSDIENLVDHVQIVLQGQLKFWRRSFELVGMANVHAWDELLNANEDRTRDTS
jgi:hypothetical protein